MNAERALAVDEFSTLGDGITLCHRSYGARTGEPLLLLAGLGLDLTWWPPVLIDELVRLGFHVIVVDNRDAGRSTSITWQLPPGLWRQLLKLPRESGYDLGDMAVDVDRLLDRLGIARAHVVGMSMGGMIAQTLAARFPARVATLTSIFSTTGNPRVGQPAVSTLVRIARPPARSRPKALARELAILRHISSGPFGFEEQQESAYLQRAWIRGHRDDACIARQINAIFKSGDRTAELRHIGAPTLVIHGDHDLMVHPSGGTATAEAIAGADLIVLEGMRHCFPQPLISRLAELIANHAWKQIDERQFKPETGVRNECDSK